MLAKILTATLTAALGFMVLRQLKQRSDEARERVRTRRREPKDGIVTLREDPETGIFRPDHRDR